MFTLKKGGPMNELETKQELQLIREMIERTRQATTRAWNYLFFWGILIILAIAGMYILVFVKKYHWIWVNWLAFVVIGIAYSIFYVQKQEQGQGVRTYAQINVAHLSIACSVGFITMGLVFPLLGLYPYGVIPVLMSIMAGILFFVLGGIYEWNLLKLCAAIWWLGAFGMILLPPEYRSLVFIPLIIVGYFVPGFILRSKYQKS
jgi:hypothetical protein